jgi:hypothetical protein
MGTAERRFDELSLLEAFRDKPVSRRTSAISG